MGRVSLEPEAPMGAREEAPREEVGPPGPLASLETQPHLGEPSRAGRRPLPPSCFPRKLCWVFSPPTAELPLTPLPSPRHPVLPCPPGSAPRGGAGRPFPPRGPDPPVW